jgi:hypothetical protein
MMSKLKKREVNKIKSIKKFYYNVALLSCCFIVAFLAVGCGSKSEKDTPKKQNSNKEVDYSEYNFAGVHWKRDAECDTETLCFLTNGEFRYSCACGNSVNDADVAESYSYDDKTKTFTLNCYEEIDDMITEIKLISCDEKTLELDFGGDIRKFSYGDKIK